MPGYPPPPPDPYIKAMQEQTQKDLQARFAWILEMKGDYNFTWILALLLFAFIILIVLNIKLR